MSNINSNNNANMKNKIWLIIIICLCLFACKNHKQNPIYEQIQYVITKSGFIELPLVFDASIESALKSNYKINRTSNDSLLFEQEIYDIIGFLPDTTNYYAFLHLAVGDMLYPTIITMDKKWQKIDEKVICTTGCLVHPFMNVTSCYDSVWVYQDLKFKSISRLIGTFEIDEDSTSQVWNICNIRILDGFIAKNGKIEIKESDLTDCN